MTDQPPKKKRKLFKVLRFILFVLIAVPLAAELFFFLTRISPGSAIPDTFSLYAEVPAPAELGSKILEHESLPELMVNPALASLTPVLSRIKESGILRKPWFRFMFRGSLSAALLDTPSRKGVLIAAWDSAFAAPLLRFLPLITRSAKAPEELRYVEDHFEYRSGDSVFYIGRKRNLLVFSDDKALFTEALLPGTSAEKKVFTMKNQDISLLLSSTTLTSALGENNPLLTRAFTMLKLPNFIETGIVIEPKQLDISIVTPVDTDSDAFETVLSKNSVPPSLVNILPDTTQYCTSLSSLTFRELLAAAAEVQDGLENTLVTADRAAKTLLGLTLEDILYSWTGDEFAVFGLEDRPAPVFAVKVADETKRQAVFNKAFRSIFLREDTRLVLDGNRIPQIELPAFVDGILRLIDVRLPEPYYTVHEGWFLVSESPENILAVVTAVQQNQLLAKTGIWHKLTNSAEDSSLFSPAASGSGNASLSLFYSLNRSLPFFLKGGSAPSSILRMYRQGLMRVRIKDKVLTLTLSAEPGSVRGLESVPGYPIALGGRTGSAAYAVLNRSGSESRLLVSRGADALSVNPADHKIYELKGEDPVWVLPAEGLSPKTMKESAAWVVSSRGLVTLVNGNMEPSPSFPVITGLKLSCAPAAWDGRIYLPVEEAGGRGVLYTIDSSARIVKLKTEFDSPILSPPSFGENSFMTLYPKSFLGEIYLCDTGGIPSAGWPLYASGIAYGSPLLFRNSGLSGGQNSGLSGRSSGTLVAFITMAGELSVYTEQGSVLSGFPMELPGVFYLQPVWDGEYLWAAAEQGSLFRVDLDGRMAEQQAPDLTVREEGCIMAADVDKDGIPEIFISGEGNAIYGYSRNLISIEGFPLTAWGRPAFADLDADGTVDCAAAGMDNKLYRWRFKQ
ncbi:MAG: VCBS repeat-containing protein [Spirochaetaceae bacterium]|jgi:hypothetical protein|nr:VCBS repeat-containing protein [Spirochaetaceae bacterium]